MLNIFHQAVTEAIVKLGKHDVAGASKIIDDHMNSEHNMGVEANKIELLIFDFNGKLKIVRDGLERARQKGMNDQEKTSFISIVSSLQKAVQKIEIELVRLLQLEEKTK